MLQSNRVPGYWRNPIVLTKWWRASQFDQAVQRRSLRLGHGPGARAVVRSKAPFDSFLPLWINLLVTVKLILTACDWPQWNIHAPAKVSPQRSERLQIFLSHGKLAQAVAHTQDFRGNLVIWQHDSTIFARSANSSWITCCKVQVAISAVSLSGCSPRSSLSIVLPPQLVPASRADLPFLFLILHFTPLSWTRIAVECECRLEGEGKSVSFASVSLSSPLW